MRPLHTPARQRGATLIVALIMIALITLLVVNAFTLSSSNLKAVNNMQMRDEAVAAANQALERVLSTPFYTALGTQTFNVDINKDGNNDFAVATGVPTCLKAWKATPGYPSDVEIKALAAGATWNVNWEVKASVTDSASGASTTVTQGVRTLLSQSEKDIACP